MKNHWKLALALVVTNLAGSHALGDEPSPEKVREGLQKFFARTAQPDGSYRPGVRADYPGMSRRSCSHDRVRMVPS
jgi:hypothetical protein